MRLTWDEVGERFYETGVNKGVLYRLDESNEYTVGVPWNGLVTVTEQPTGAEATATYADNIKYLNLIAQELFGATIEAYTYPDEFAECDGTVEPVAGVSVGQQSRKTFGLCYTTLLGNDTDGTDYGFKLHMVWGATATPSEKAYGTVNDTPAAITFSWTLSTIPVAVEDLKPTSIITIDSTKVDADTLDDLMDILYGTDSVDPRLPLPDEIISMFEAVSITTVDLGVPANQPTYNSSTHVVTLPSVSGVTWKINGVAKSPGAQTAMTTGQTSLITANANEGYVLAGDDDWAFDY